MDCAECGSTDVVFGLDPSETEDDGNASMLCKECGAVEKL